jgi:hypothetical protein
MIAAQFRGGNLLRQPHHRLHLSENGKPAHSASVQKQGAGLPICTVTGAQGPRLSMSDSTVRGAKAGIGVFAGSSAAVGHLDRSHSGNPG